METRSIITARVEPANGRTTEATVTGGVHKQKSTDEEILESML
jgi:hypothetical protein